MCRTKASQDKTDCDAVQHLQRARTGKKLSPTENEKEDWFFMCGCV